MTSPHGGQPEAELPPQSAEAALAQELGYQTPEARRQAAIHWQRRARQHFDDLSARHETIIARIGKVLKRVWDGAYHDGFIHAGNLAYMAILALFPFFITATAIFSLFGEEGSRLAALDAFLSTVPGDVAEVIGPVGRDVISARSGWLLWLGGAVGLWTVGSLIETIRDILRRAYGTRAESAFWRYRAGSLGVVVGAVVLLLISFALQVLITAAQEAITHLMPQFDDWVAKLALSRFVPGLGLLLSIWLVFIALTPSAYRGRRYPKWPGAILVAGWWILVATWLPSLLQAFFTYDLTYGSLAGVMIALFFFWLIGLGVVVGAELNAALAESPEEHDMLGQSDDRGRRAGLRSGPGSDPGRQDTGEIDRGSEQA